METKTFNVLRKIAAAYSGAPVKDNFRQIPGVPGVYEDKKTGRDATPGYDPRTDFEVATYAPIPAALNPKLRPMPAGSIGYLNVDIPGGATSLYPHLRPRRFDSIERYEYLNGAPYRSPAERVNTFQQINSAWPTHHQSGHGRNLFNPAAAMKLPKPRVNAFDGPLQPAYGDLDKFIKR